MSGVIKTSEALKVNLAETFVAGYEFSEQEKFILNAVEKHPLLEKRMRTFFLELNHPFPNFTEVIEAYRWITLENMWVFADLEESSELLKLLGQYFMQIFSQKLDIPQRNRLRQTIFNVLELLYKILQSNKISDDVFNSFLDITETVLADGNPGLMEASSSLKKYVADISKDGRFSDRIFKMLKRVMTINLDYWKNLQSFSDWLENRKIEHGDEALEIENAILSQFPPELFTECEEGIEKAEKCEDFFKLPDYTFFTDRFRNTIDFIPTPICKIYYIFYLLDFSSMESLREYLLFDLNRTLKIVSIDDTGEAKRFITRMFDFFKPVRELFQSAILDCVKTLGKEIVKRGSATICDHFFDAVIRFGFVYPELKGVNSDWQMIVDKNHVKNIRTWLEIIEVNPSKSTKLLSALLVNLRIGGVFISDTDLFQSDVTKFLNSQIAPAYHIARQIAVLFPVYFNEIGAEGELRKISTAIDEICHRKDLLTHFLRKQIHAESNNTHIQLAKDVFVFWLTGKKEHLKNKIPDEIYETLEPAGELYEGLHEVARFVTNRSGGDYETLFTMKPAEVEKIIADFGAGHEVEQKKVGYLFNIYLLLKEKYYLNPGDIAKKLKKITYIHQATIDEFEAAMTAEDWKSAVRIAFKIMSALKKTVLSEEQTEGVENIYYKRHIAIGIPSMYGEYREPKFEALGMIYRMEQLVSTMVEKLVSTTKLPYVSADNLRETCEILELFREGLELGGITSESFNSDLKMLEYSLVSSSFSLHQYTNIFEFFAEDLSKIVYDYFLGIHDQNLKVVLEQYIEKHNLTVSSEKDKEKIIHKKSEEFYRDIISSSFLMQQIDSLINYLLSILHGIPKNLTQEDIHMIMTYKRKSIISEIDKKDDELDNQVFFGAKGYFLKKIKEYGMPVPHGFILTTELFRRREALMKHPEIEKEIYTTISDALGVLEEKTGLQYGNPNNPLMLSVRSGSAMSMPGAMNTFLNVGMNDEFVEQLAKKENYGWTSWDCYRRLIQTWGMNFGIDRDLFDKVIADFKKVYGVEKKIGFRPEVMKEIAKEYMKILKSQNVVFEQNLHKQLFTSIHAVFDSWNSRRALVYRDKLHIASEWGTAVIVQKMVLGNINYDSGTGVVFTREPNGRGRKVSLYGDFVMCSQGEDIVGGLVHPYPVSEKQRLNMKNAPDISMEKDFPEIYSALNEISVELINKRGFGHQEIEFTFETSKREDLHILQIRSYHQNDLMQEELVPDNLTLIGEGTGIGNNVLTGRVVFSMEDIEKCKQLYPGEKIIVMRPDTVSDDIDMIFEADGLLTSRGGATSHAAVTAVRLGKIGVVNCKSLTLDEANKTFTFGGETRNVLCTLTIDGRRGFIYG